jgi:gliding motility-associated-like protein
MAKLLRGSYLWLSFVLTLFTLSAKAQTANFTADVTSGCAPLIVHFHNTSSGATSYSWNLGNGTPPIAQQDVSGTFLNPGTYTVVLTAYSAGGGTSTHSMTITVYPAPIVNFSASPLAGCPGTTITFSDQSNLQTLGAATYSWNYGDGYTGTGQNPSHTFNIPGSFNITEVVTNGEGCISSLTQSNYITIYQKPIISFTSNTQQFCSLPGHAQFTSNITGTGPYVYFWKFGDGGTSTMDNPPHDYTAYGNYSVTLYVTDAHGCSDSVKYNNYIHVSSISGGFTAPTEACINTSVPFTDTSSGNPQTTWTFGDGGTSNAYSPTHTYTVAGTYTVTLTVNNGSCIDTINHTIIIHPSPVINFTVTPTIPCPPPVGVQFTSTAPAGSSYTWDFGDGGNSFAQNPPHTYNAAGIYTITLTVHDANNCVATISKPDTLYDHFITLNVNPDSGCAPLPVSFSVNNLTHWPIPPVGPFPYPSPITSYSWHFGDGGTSTQSAPTYTYNTPGIYTASVTTTTANGCTASTTYTIYVGSHPTAAFTDSPSHICADHTVYFTNQSTGNPTGYLWIFGDGGTSGDVNPTHYYQIPATYDVWLIAYNNGCADTLIKHNLITVDSPKALFEPTPLCNPHTSVSFLNQSIGATTFTWIFGDGNIDNTTLNPIHNYPALGYYTVLLATYNATSGCRDTMTQQIDLVQLHPTFTVLDTAICKYDNIHFTPIVTGNGTPSSYLWIISNIAYPKDTIAYLVDTFMTAGIYPVTLVTTDINGCKDTAFKNNYIHVDKPVVDFTGTPVSGCVPLQVNFTDNTTDQPGTTLTNHYWTYGDGNNQSVPGNTVSHTYNTAGVYDVTEVVTDNIGCKDTLTKTAYITAIKPHAAFTAANLTPCRKTPVVFNNTSSGNNLTYSWNFGDGTTSTVQSPNHPYYTNGTFTVTLTVTDATGCTDTYIATNYITVQGPIVNFAMSDSQSICPPLSVHFTPQVTGGSPYIWNFGNGNQSFVPSPDNTYTSSGYFTVYLIGVDNHGCRDTAFHHVNIYGYAGAFSYTPLLGCAPLDVAFTANLQNVPSVTWDFADGNTTTTTLYNVTHTYTTPGAYVPRLILTDTTCQSSSVGIDTIKVDGVIPAFNTTPPCIGDTLQFTDNSNSLFSPVVGWHWTFDNGDTSDLSNPVHYYPDTGTYPVVLYAINANGCFGTSYDTVYIHPLPHISAGNDTTICLHDAATLDPSGGVSYTWSPASTLSCSNCTNPQASPTVATTYTVIGADQWGCKNNDSMVVSIKTKTHSISHDAELCFSDSIRLFDSGAQNYTWFPPDGLSNSTIGNPVASPTASMTYTVITRDGSCEPDTNYVHVTVHPTPTVDAGNDQTIVAGDQVQLDATGQYISTYFWRPADYLSCDSCQNPIASPHTSTTFVVYVASDFGCRDSDKVHIDVICERSQVFIPNTFTPNGDGQNDLFYPRGKGISIIKSFRIYNRWGELVFEKENIQINDESNAWDGTYMGEKPKPDVYVYIMDALCDTGAPLNYKGDVTIIR